MHKVLADFLRTPELRVPEFETQSLETFLVCFDWIKEMMLPDRWNLSATEMALLLGINESEFNELVNEPTSYKKFLPGIAYRISYLLGIHKAFAIINPLPGNKPAYAMFWKNQYQVLDGKSVKDFLLSNPTNDCLRAVRSWLNSTRMPSTYDF